LIFLIPDVKYLGIGNGAPFRTRFAKLSPMWADTHAQACFLRATLLEPDHV
jgi:hypothetical protein